MNDDDCDSDMTYTCTVAARGMCVLCRCSAICFYCRRVISDIGRAVSVSVESHTLDLGALATLLPFFFCTTSRATD